MKSLLHRYLRCVLPDALRFRAIRNFRQNRASLAPYIKQIENMLPGRKIRHAKLISTGFDHIVLVDRNTLFRFPRNETYRTGLLQEVHLLEKFQARDLGVRVPEYSYVEPSGFFGCYEMLHGRELGPDHFGSLDRAVQETILRKMAGFLSALHDLPVDIAQNPGEMFPQHRRDHRFSHGEFQDRKPILATVADPGLMAALVGFFDRFSNPPPVRARMVHADLIPGNILFSPHHGVGVIDFSDSGVGDPAWDFAMLGSYGDWVLPFLLDHYAFSGDDPALAQRARQQAVRYWTERLFWKLNGRYPDDKLDRIVAMIQTSLQRVDYSQGPAEGPPETVAP